MRADVLLLVPVSEPGDSGYRGGAYGGTGSAASQKSIPEWAENKWAVSLGLVWSVPNP